MNNGNRLDDIKAPYVEYLNLIEDLKLFLMNMRPGMTKPEVFGRCGNVDELLAKAHNAMLNLGFLKVMYEKDLRDAEEKLKNRAFGEVIKQRDISTSPEISDRRFIIDKMELLTETIKGLMWDLRTSNENYRKLIEKEN